MAYKLNDLYSALKKADAAGDTEGAKMIVGEIRNIYASYDSKYGLKKGTVESIINSESTHDPNAVSKRNAKGLMQLMPNTAKSLGVKDPFDPEQNIDAGAKYYAQLVKDNGGDYKKAAIAYNWGPGNVASQGVANAPAASKSYADSVVRGISSVSKTVPPASVTETPAVTAKTTAASETPLSNALLATGMPQLGAGMLKGMAIEPLKAIANLGVAGALKVGAITQEQANAFATKEAQLNQMYQQTFQPSELGTLVGGMLIPVGKMAAIPQVVAKGAVLGGMQAAAQNAPSSPDFAQNVLGGAGLGAGTAGALSAAGKVASAVAAPFASALHNYINPLGRWGTEVTGGQPQEALNALQAARQTFVPGVGAGTVAENLPQFPRVAATEKAITGTLTPEQNLARNRADYEAMASHLFPVAGDEATLADAIATRKEVTDPLYDAARKSTQVVDMSNVIGNLDELIRNSAQYPKRVKMLSELRKLAKNTHTSSDAVSLMENIKDKASAQEGGSFLQGNLSNIARMVAESNPVLTQAENEFSRLSQPINQMKIGQHFTTMLKDAAQNNPNTSASYFANKIRGAIANPPKFLNDVTGFSGNKAFEDVLTPQHIGLFGDVLNELQRREGAEIGAAAARPVIPGEAFPSYGSIGNKIGSWVDTAIQFATGQRNENMARSLAQELRNPNSPLVTQALKNAVKYGNTNEAAKEVSNIVRQNVSKFGAVAAPAYAPQLYPTQQNALSPEYQQTINSFVNPYK